MKGANEYCKIFKKAEQVGKLYLLPSSHARGVTFNIYVLPEGEDVIENGGFNPPLNKNAVEVYGVVSGQLGWTEEYGWLHQGKWVADFNALVDERKNVLNQEKALLKNESDEAKRIKNENIIKLLRDYS